MANEYLQQAVAKAQAGDWEQAHQIIQAYDDANACWIHAVLHKMEGDESNSRYWYARTQHKYEDFTEAKQELKAIAAQLKGHA